MLPVHTFQQYRAFILRQEPAAIVSFTIWPLELMSFVKDVLPKAKAIMPTLARRTVMP